MKRSIVGLWVSLALLLVPLVAIPATAQAVDVFKPCARVSSSDVCKDVRAQGGSTKNPIVSFIKVIIQVVAVVVGIASVIIIIVSGIRLVASAGDPQAAASARSGITYALVGLVIVIISEALVAFVLNRLQ